MPAAADRISRIEGHVSSPVLVGRARELDALVEAVAASPAVGVVEGEPGIGKTRLVQELLCHPALAGRVRLLGHCPPLREPFPLAPVAEAIRRAAPTLALGSNPLFGALRGLLPELADRLPRSPSPLGDPRGERRRLFDAMRSLLSDLGPAVLVLEDLHWADPGSLEFLRFLLADPPTTLSVVATFRREDLVSTEVPSLFARPPLGASFVRVSLRSLEPEHVGALVSAILETDRLSDDFVGYLCERTGGIPFVVEEILWLLRDRQDMVRRDGRWVRQALDTFQPSTTFRDWFLDRVERLGPDARHLARVAAVLRIPGEELVLAGVAGFSPPRTARAIERCVAAALIEEKEPKRYGFRHVLGREAVYGSMGETERRRLHLRAARVLGARTPRPHAQLAFHYRRADRPDEWVRHAEAAARKAIALGDDAAAASFLQDALEAPGLPPRVRVRLATALGRAALHGLAHAESLPILRRILEEESLPAGSRGEISLSLGLLLIQNGNAEEGFAAVGRAFPLLRRRPGLASRAAATMASPWRADARAEDLPIWIERAMAAAAGQADPTVSTAARVDRAFVLSCLADPQAEEAIREVPWDAPSIGERRQLVRGRLNLAHAAFHLGRYRAARIHLDEGGRLSAELNYVRQREALETAGVLLDWATGRWEGLAERCLALCEAAADVPHAAVDARFVLGALLHARGDPDAADILGEALRTARACGSLPILAAAAGALARLRMEGGDADGAHEVTAGVLASTGIWVWAAEVVPPAVEALLATGRRREAEDALRRFGDGLRGRQAPAARAALATARGLAAESAGDPATAARSFAVAERAWAGMPNPYRAAAAQEARARALLHGSDRPGGTLALRQALQGFEQLGAARDAARTRRALREHGIGVPYPWRGGRRGYGSELSPREREVCELAAEGKTNREMAQELFISPKTVEHHVSSAMRKLGVRSRRALPSTLSAPAGGQE